MNRPEKNYTLVVGMGKTGHAIARFLKSRGERVVLADRDTSKTHAAHEFRQAGIAVELGPHKKETFENARMIVVSPGIPLTIAELEAARQKGVPVTGELDIIAAYMDRPVIAVTGTNGKTTTTELIGGMLKCSGQKVFVGGNIGTPIVDYIGSGNETDTVVVEISSFQLDSSDRFSPDIAVLLNISEDHLDRYADFDAYENAKWSIFKNQTADQTAIINFAIRNVAERIKSINSRILIFGEDDNKTGLPGAWISEDRITTPSGQIDLGSALLKGAHNRENIAAAVLAAMAAGGTMEGVARSLKSFSPLPHRLALAGTLKGVRFYNDSKATNPDAVKRALECVNGLAVLIMGGQEKDTDFTCLKETVQAKVKKLIAMGEARDKISTAFSSVCNILYADGMAQAVEMAYKNADSGDTVLLSPGCASFDMYSSYVERGNDFHRHVKRLGRLQERTET